MKNTLIVILLFAQIANGQNPLFIPDTLSGTNISLDIKPGVHQFFSGQITETMGVNGNILGPTLILNQGDFVNFTVNNLLPDATTLHWHGLHVAPENDGGPHTPIAPNTSWEPAFTILDKASTYWYHSHLHHKTNEHVTKGVAGLIIVKDSEEAALTLPRTYGTDDFPLIIQTKDFDANNQIVVHSNSDDRLMVNATLDPYLEVPAQIVRFRILNGSSQRAFNLGLGNNQNFHQIASDGGLLSTPYQTSRLLLSPGERAEILVDLSGMNRQIIFLKSFASELPGGIYGAANPGMGPGLTLNGYNPNPLNGTDFNILQIKVIAPTASAVTGIPSNLATLNLIPESSAMENRTFVFSPETPGPNQLNGKFTINNTLFDMNVINHVIPKDNIEIWTLTNNTAIAHPFHIHMVPFYILTRNGIPPPPNEQGRKDVVLVRPQETVRFITKFEGFANPNVPYMYHCHLLTHEDDGMMGQFIVVDPLSVKGIENNEKSIKLYPNPTLANVTIEVNNSLEVVGVEVYNITGKKLLNAITIENGYLIPADALSKGIYLVKVNMVNGYITKKIIRL